MPVNMEVEDEKFERPQSVSSIGKVLEHVKSETTPRAEKEEYFQGDGVAPPMPVGAKTLAPPPTIGGQVTFKQFLLGGEGEDLGPETPDSFMEVEARARGLKLDPMDAEEPKTPTQAGFNV